jgi:hypothetical protein
VAPGLGLPAPQRLDHRHACQVPATTVADVNREPVSLLGGRVGKIEAARADELQPELFQGDRQQAEQALAAGRFDRAAGVGQAAAQAPCGRCRLGRPEQGTRFVERLGLVQRAGEQGLRLLVLTGEHLREAAEQHDHEAVARGQSRNIRRALAEPDAACTRWRWLSIAP